MERDLKKIIIRVRIHHLTQKESTMSARVDAEDDVAPLLVPAGAHASPHKKNGVASASVAADNRVSPSPSMISTFTPGAWKSLLAFFILSFAYIAGKLSGFGGRKVIFWRIFSLIVSIDRRGFVWRCKIFYDFMMDPFSRF